MTNPRHGYCPTIALFKCKTVEDAMAHVAAGGDVHGRNEKGFTPLFYAVRKGNRAVAGYFLSQGACVDVRDARGQPLAIAAARNHDPDLLDDLIGVGLDPFLRDAQGHTGLMVATYPRVMRRLLDLGLDVHATNARGLTVLHCMVGDPKRYVLPASFAYLLEAGADVDARTPGGLTPLMMTSREEGVEALLGAGADASLTDAQGKNALHHLVSSYLCVKPRVVEMLVLNGADPLQQDAEGASALDLLTSDAGKRIFGGPQQVGEVMSCLQREMLACDTPAVHSHRSMRL